MTQALDRGFFDRPVLEVARDLVGCVVVAGDCRGVIVETEAYHQSEPACHAHRGFTPAKRHLFGPPGSAYVYRSYGIHAMLNAVCEAAGVGAAVLIRALEPTAGVAVMRSRRGAAGARDLAELCSGPGKLAQALGVELAHDGSSLIDGPVRVLAAPRTRLQAGRRGDVVAGRRVGITRATELPWRFCAADSAYVSRPWPPGLRGAPRPITGPPRRPRRSR